MLLYAAGRADSGERSSVQLLTTYQPTSHVLTVRKPGVNIMTDFDISFTL